MGLRVPKPVVGAGLSLSVICDGRMKSVEAFTDGACKGKSHWGRGVLLRSGEHTREIFGGEAETTNNRMELTAAIEALSALKDSCRVDDNRFDLRSGRGDPMDGQMGAQWLAHSRRQAG